MGRIPGHGDGANFASGTFTSTVQNPTRDRGQGMYCLCTTRSQALGFSTCLLSLKSKLPPPYLVGRGEGEDRRQSEMPRYLVPPSPSRRDEGPKSNFPRDELLPRDKIIRLVYQRQVRYEDTWIFAPCRKLAVPGRRRRRSGAYRRMGWLLTLSNGGLETRGGGLEGHPKLLAPLLPIKQ